MDHTALSPEGVQMSEMRSAEYTGAELSEDPTQPIGGISVQSLSYGL